MTIARAFWVTGEQTGEIRDVPVGAPRAGELLIETLFSAVSRGTETLVFAGRVPAGEYESMRAPFQEGGFPAPVKYGYINVGRVVGGDGLSGKTVFCLYPHQTRFVVPATAVTVVPETIPAGRAVLAAGLETAVNAVWTRDRTSAIGSPSSAQARSAAFAPGSRAGFPEPRWS